MEQASGRQRRRPCRRRTPWRHECRHGRLKARATPDVQGFCGEAALCGTYLVSFGSLPPRDSSAQAGRSAALLALAAAARWRAPAALLDTRQAASLPLLALVPGLAGTILYYRGLVHTRASRAAVAELSFPAVATLLNWAFLGTPVSAVQLAGFVLLWGVILNLERRRHAESGD